MYGFNIQSLHNIVSRSFSIRLIKKMNDLFSAAIWIASAKLYREELTDTTQLSQSLKRQIVGRKHGIPQNIKNI